MTNMRGYADDLELMTWLTTKIFPCEGKWVGPEFVEQGASPPDYIYPLQSVLPPPRAGKSTGRLPHSCKSPRWWRGGAGTVHAIAEMVRGGTTTSNAGPEETQGGGASGRALTG